MREKEHGRTEKVHSGIWSVNGGAGGDGMGR